MLIHLIICSFKLIIFRVLCSRGSHTMTRNKTKIVCDAVKIKYTHRLWVKVHRTRLFFFFFLHRFFFLSLFLYSNNFDKWLRLLISHKRRLLSLFWSCWFVASWTLSQFFFTINHHFVGIFISHEKSFIDS